MAYDLHITRTKLWFNSNYNPISMSEWSNYVLDDPSLKFVYERQSDNKTVLSYYNEGLVVWINELIEENKNLVYLDYVHGRIVTKNPNKATIVKIKEIAEKLYAFVVGDEGEEY